MELAKSRLLGKIYEKAKLAKESNSSGTVIHIESSNKKR